MLMELFELMFQNSQGRANRLREKKEVCRECGQIPIFLGKPSKLIDGLCFTCKCIEEGVVLDHRGTPDHPPEYDMDEFAQCRELLAEFGHDDVDPEDFDCTEPGVLTSGGCPVAEECARRWHDRYGKKHSQG